jgi:hypothetical protein
VKYSDLVGHRRSPTILEAICKPIPGVDSFGEIAQAQLGITGDIKLARAQVLYTTLDNGNPDPRFYKLAVAAKVILLHADYFSCLEGTNQVRDHEEVYCLRLYQR